MSYYYQVKIHRAFNLPKVDVLTGSIDAYFKVISTTASGSQIQQTETVDSNRNPKFKRSLIVQSSSPVVALRLELWDSNMILKNTHVATLLIEEPVTSFYKKTFPITKWENKYKATDASVVVSAGLVYGYPSMKQFCLQTRRDVVADDKSQSITFPLFAADVGADGLLAMGLKFERDCKMDIILYEIYPLPNISKLAELGMATTGYKYTVKRENYSKPHVLPGGKLTAYAETKFDDLPFYYPFKEIRIYLNNVQVLMNSLLSDISPKYGWKGMLSYQGAKSTLKNTIFVDKEEAAYMITDHTLVKSDWDSSNSDMSHLLREHAFHQGVVVDLTHAKKTKRTITYYSKPKKIGGTCTVLAKVTIDDLPYPVMHNELTMVTLKRVKGIAQSFTAIIPLK